MRRREFMSWLSVGASGMFLPWHGAQAGSGTLRGYLRTNWSRDPYSLGSYSYVAKGAQQSDRMALGTSIDSRIYFAGEAVHPYHNSTVHGAYESGLMVANAVGQEPHKNIGVVGAGISGLAVAHALAQNEKSVTVFEAKERIGGRIWTSDALGTPLDLGASWIHGTRLNPLTALAQSMNITTVRTDNSYVMRGAGGRIIDDEQEPDWLEDITNIQHDAGADISELNLKAYLAQLDYDGDEVIFPQGYANILDALQGDYEIRKSETVTAIRYSKNGVAIVSNGVESLFDAVIVTLPLGVLKNNSVTFSPALPQDKQEAIERLGMGTLDKLYLLYDQPFWDEDITWIATPENGLPQGHFNEWLNFYKYLKMPIIMAFNGGLPALELSHLSDEELVLKAQKVLQGAYP